MKNKYGFELEKVTRIKKPDILFEEKPVYHVGERVMTYDGRTFRIEEAEDTRDRGNQFRPDWKDGMEYIGIDKDGNELSFRWWEIRLV